MKNILTIVTVLFFSLNMNAQVEGTEEKEKYTDVALSFGISNPEQVELEELMAITNSMEKLISENGKVASDVSSPYMLYLSYSFDSKKTIDADADAKLGVNLNFYIVDNVSKRQAASTSIKLFSDKKDENSALSDVLLSIKPKDENIQNMLRNGREEIYSSCVLQCLDFLNLVQTNIHQNKEEKAIGALLNLPEFEDDCKMMSEQLMIEAVNGKKMSESSKNMESLVYYIENKLDGSEVKLYADLLVANSYGKELLSNYIEGYSNDDEYLKILKESNQKSPEPSVEAEIRLKARKLITTQQQEKLDNLMMLANNEMWLNELGSE